MCRINSIIFDLVFSFFWSPTEIANRKMHPNRTRGLTGNLNCIFFGFIKIKIFAKNYFQTS